MDGWSTSPLVPSEQDCTPSDHRPRPPPRQVHDPSHPLGAKLYHSDPLGQGHVTSCALGAELCPC